MDHEFKEMIMEYMNNGFLENIISLMKQDESLYDLIPEMIQDERIRVRVGAASLVEELVEWQPEKLFHLIPILGAMLDNENPVIRGDAAAVLQSLRHREALPWLIKHKDDEHFEVKEIISEAIEDLEVNALYP